MATSFANRMVGAARLDRAVYEEVEADTGATGQALGVVALSSVATGIAFGGGLGGLVTGAVAGVLTWALWAALIYWIGARLLPEPQTRADWGELARTLGFAASPGILRVLAVIPGLAVIVVWITIVWTLITTVVAVRQALDYRSTPRAIGVCLIGWFVQTALLVLLGRLARPL